MAPPKSQEPLDVSLGQIPWRRDFAHLSLRFGSRTAVTWQDDEISFDVLMRHAFSLADALRALEIKPGEPVATYLQNSPHAVWASYGIVMSGAAETGLDPNLGASDLDWCLSLAKVATVVTTAANADEFKARGARVVTVENICAAASVNAGKSEAAVPADALGKVIFTSGTTGRPKAILHSHGRRWLSNITLRAHLPFTPDAGDRILLMTPFTHGASLLTYAFLDHGASIRLLEGVKVQAVRTLLDEREVNTLFAPPTVLAKLVADLEGRRYNHVRAVFCGTATLQPALYHAALKIFGPVVRVTYGKSEMFNPITVLPAADCEAYYSQPDAFEGVCLGWPANGVEVLIDGEGPGEILLRSPHMLVGQITENGYEPHLPNAFHASGDMGHIDERGRLYLTGRTKDAIKTGGYKVFPEEIERAFDHEVAVIGFPSDYWGEVIVAVAEAGDIVKWPPEHAPGQLTRYKQPRAYLLVERFPRSTQGKVQRQKIKEIVVKRYRLVDGSYPKLEPLYA